MQIGLALLAVGAALLGYVVTTRQPAPAAGKPKSLAPRARSAPPGFDAGDAADPDEALLIRVQSTLSCAVLDLVPDGTELSAPLGEFPAPNSTPRVINSTDSACRASTSLARLTGISQNKFQKCVKKLAFSNFGSL